MEHILTGEGPGDIRAPERWDGHQPTPFLEGEKDCLTIAYVCEGNVMILLNFY